MGEGLSVIGGTGTNSLPVTYSTVSKLREHWDETNSAVLARKTQLDAMLADSQKLETKRAEVEAWLARMEHRLERLQVPAHTPEMLDQQIREQKVSTFCIVLTSYEDIYFSEFVPKIDRSSCSFFFG